MQLSCDIFAHHASHLVVVGTDEGGVFLRTGLALKDNDRDALVVGTVDGWRDGGHLVGGNNEQVNARCHKTVNLLDLSLVTIVSYGKSQLHIALQISTHAQFGILLLAPDVF